MKAILAACLLVASSLGAVAQQPSAEWQTRLAQVLPLLGHRNWIMIVDSAYPLQSSSGVETIETNTDQMEVIPQVLGAIDKPTTWSRIGNMEGDGPTWRG